MASLLLVGAGVIGSHALPHLARLAGVSRITVVDHDTYEPRNLFQQHIFTADIGKPKAHVQAQRVWQINPALAERSIQKPVESLSLGSLRCDVILAAVDSRRARMVINQAAWRLGVPWIDAGVDADGLLARVQVFIPGQDAPCLECAWDDRDYALVDQAYPCRGATDAPATGASSGLGALAAALQAVECQKLLEGEREHLLAGRQVLIDLRHHRHFVTTFRHNPNCRMPDHVGWTIDSLELDPASSSIDALAAYAATLFGAGASVGIGVAGQMWAISLTCDACGQREPAAEVVRGDPRPNPGRCRDCGGSRRATGFDLREQAAVGELLAGASGRSLSSLGLLLGDVLTLSADGGERHVEIAEPTRLSAAAWPAGQDRVTPIVA